MDLHKSRNRTPATRLTRASWATFGLAAGFALLAGAQPARAADDGDSFYNQTFGRVLTTLGLKSADEEEIHYRERAPLVLPSSRALPPPESADVTVNPAWPKDPDVKRRKLIEQQQKNRNTEAERLRELNPLPPDQLAPGPRPRGVTHANTESPSPPGTPLSPNELGYKGGLFRTMFDDKREDVARFTGEPPRTELTAPPPGYQTPSPDQPYGVGQAPPKVDNDYVSRGEIKR